MEDFTHKKVKKTPEQLMNMREVGGTAVEIEGFKGNIDEQTLAMAKSIVDDIGTHKQKGVVFVVGNAGDRDEDGKVPPNGIFFTHGMGIMSAILLLIKSSGVDPAKVIARIYEETQ